MSQVMSAIFWFIDRSELENSAVKRTIRLLASHHIIKEYTDVRIAHREFETLKASGVVRPHIVFFFVAEDEATTISQLVFLQRWKASDLVKIVAILPPTPNKTGLENVKMPADMVLSQPVSFGKLQAAFIEYIRGAEPLSTSLPVLPREFINYLEWQHEIVAEGEPEEPKRDLVAFTGNRSKQPLPLPSPLRSPSSELILYLQRKISEYAVERAVYLIGLLPFTASMLKANLELAGYQVVITTRVERIIGDLLFVTWLQSLARDPERRRQVFLALRDATSRKDVLIDLIEPRILQYEEKKMWLEPTLEALNNEEVWTDLLLRGSVPPLPGVLLVKWGEPELKILNSLRSNIEVIGYISEVKELEEHFDVGTYITSEEVMAGIVPAIRLAMRTLVTDVETRPVAIVSRKRHSFLDLLRKCIPFLNR